MSSSHFPRVSTPPPLNALTTHLHSAVIAAIGVPIMLTSPTIRHFFSTASRGALSAWLAWVSAAVLLMLVSSAFADPPARVGRIGFVEGDVSFYAERSEGWKPARLNFPVTSKNSIWTNGPGRAEVRIGASALRIEGDSILDFSRVDDARTISFLQRGVLNVRLRSYSTDDYRDTFRIETSEGVAILESNGRYRIETSQERSETRVAVFAGRVRFESGANALNVDAGKTLVASINAGAPSFAFTVASETPFDRWAEARDQRWDDTHARYGRERVVSTRMTGYEDLDEYGEWVEDPEYGRIWAPRVVVADWAPYRYGSWAYVRPWGWTWVDDAPWGFAPFHYGRWVFRASRWFWWPGAYNYRPVYAPALVGWYGRPGWSVSVSASAPVGWFPLAPREHFVPTYTNNVAYIRQINNVTGNVTINPPPPNFTFANQLPGATVVQSNVMLNGESVWRNANHRAATKPLRVVDIGGGNVAPAITLTPPAMPPADPRAPAFTRGTAPVIAGESSRPTMTRPVPQPVFVAPPSAQRLPGTPAMVNKPARVSATNEPSALPQPSPRAPIVGGVPAAMPNPGNIATPPTKPAIDPDRFPRVRGEPTQRAEPRTPRDFQERRAAQQERRELAPHTATPSLPKPAAVPSEVRSQKKPAHVPDEKMKKGEGREHRAGGPRSAEN